MQSRLKASLLAFFIPLVAFFLPCHLKADDNSMNTKEHKNPIVVIETNKGNVEVTLWPKVAPLACENFISLAKSGYYNNTIFHRIIPDFMIQGGDPTGTGAGGNSIWGKPFKDECPHNVKFDRPGLLAMANAGPNTNGSQFFITTVPTSWLNGKHTIFGEVSSGMDIVQKIEDVGSSSGRPREKVIITKMVVLSDE